MGKAKQGMSSIGELAEAAMDERLSRTFDALRTPATASTPRKPSGRASEALRARKSKPDNTTPAAAAIKAYMHPTTPEQDN